MPSPSLRHTLRRLWALDTFGSSLRVFIALTGSMALCWQQERMDLLIPLFLGIIASALAETDDSWRGRLRALLVTLAASPPPPSRSSCCSPIPGCSSSPWRCRPSS